MMGGSSMGGRMPPPLGCTSFREAEPYEPSYRPQMMMPMRGSEFGSHSGFSGFNSGSQSQSIALFSISSDATNSLYVDGVPNDTNEREVSRTSIPNVDIFRPFPGFQCVRLIPKTANNNRNYYLCFVDFENALQATIAMSTLQGYRFDKSDKVGLKISYAN